MQENGVNLEWTNKPFTETLVDLVAFRQLFSNELPKNQKNALLKGIQERCVACLEALSNSIFADLPSQSYPKELKDVLVKNIKPLKKKFSLLAELRGKTMPLNSSKIFDDLIPGRNEKISHPKVKKYGYQITSNKDGIVYFKTNEEVGQVIDPDQMIASLLDFIDQFFFNICHISENEVKTYLLDHVALSDGRVGILSNTDLKPSLEFIKSELKLNLRFLEALEEIEVVEK